MVFPCVTYGSDFDSTIDYPLGIYVRYSNFEFPKGRGDALSEGVERVNASDIKHVPEQREQREAVRRLADALGAGLDRSRPLTLRQLEDHAGDVLAKLSLPSRFLGFAMLSISNVFWREQFEAVPFHRRLFMLPNCLRDRARCKGTFDSVGLRCAGCGGCGIDDLKCQADALGYQTLVAEGTPTVMMKVAECDADAIIGVACLDSLEKAFHSISDLGIPFMAVPLLRNGCVNTAIEPDQIQSLLTSHRGHAIMRTHSYAPLLREAASLFEPRTLAEMLEPATGHIPDAVGAMTDTESIALDWLGSGGKRLRPFVTFAAYAVARHGEMALEPDADVKGLIPVSVRKIALGIETLHKASLMHDDIEDDDASRGGKATVHRTHGVGPAINVGDYLVGLGYRLIAGEAAVLGGECVADILVHLSSSHLELCRGQGAELLWPKNGKAPRPIDALSIYALKTAPAFETSLYAGLRLADARVDARVLKRFCTLLGEGYQLLNDLDNWRDDGRNALVLGRDAIAGRPTILRAFAIEAGGGDRLTALSATANGSGDPALVSRIKELYVELGVFKKAKELLSKLRSHADAVAGEMEDPVLANLLRFLLGIVL